MSTLPTVGHERRLAIRSVGMVCPVGLDAASGCAAIRARISRFEEVPFHDGAWQPIVGSPVPEIAPNRQGWRRLAPLLTRAVLDCLEPAGAPTLTAGGALPLLIAIDDPERPDFPEDLPARLVAEVRVTLGKRISDSPEVLAEGPCSFFRALDRARQVVAAGGGAGCLVAAVDSLLNGRALARLEEQGRLLTERNSDGVIPGEAAAAVWVTPADGCSAALAEVVGIGFGEELSALEEDRPNVAMGMAQAMRQALADANLTLPEIDFRVGGMTGEQATFGEASTALARIQRVHKEQFELWGPAEILGDVGAALTACMTVVTAVGIAKGYAPGRRALLYAFAPSAARSACVISAPGGS